MAEKKKALRPKRNRKLPPDPFGDMPQHIAELESMSFQDLDAMGVLKPENNIWRGYDGKLDDEVFFRDDRDPRGALMDILCAIVEANCDAESEKAKRKRVEMACHMLLNIEQKPGPKVGEIGIDKQQFAREVALEFFWRDIDPRRGERTWKNCVEFVLGADRTKQWKDQGNRFDNFYNDLMNIIGPIEDQLLIEVSAKGLPQWERRRRRLDRVLADLRALGIVSVKSTG